MRAVPPHLQDLGGPRQGGCIHCACASGTGRVCPPVTRAATPRRHWPFCPTESAGVDETCEMVKSSRLCELSASSSFCGDVRSTSSLQCTPVGTPRLPDLQTKAERQACGLPGTSRAPSTSQVTPMA